jgi:hypothetical protein
MNLLQEKGGPDFKFIRIDSYVYCKIFEDNSGTLQLARLPKLRPRAKHINVCCHHFCEHVHKGLIKIFPADTKDQITDALAKALAKNDFQRHCCYMCCTFSLKATKVRGSSTRVPAICFFLAGTLLFKALQIKIKTDRQATKQETIFDNAHQQTNCLIVPSSR